MKILFLLFIFGCAALTNKLSTPDEKKFTNRFLENKNGIIILKLDSTYLTTTWCKSDLRTEINYENCVKIRPSKYYQILMLEPGFYEVSEYETISQTQRLMSHNNKKINPIISNITKKRKDNPILSFEILSDKIIYAGKIKFRASSQPATQVIDEFDLVFELEEKLFKNYDFELSIVKKNDKILIKKLAKTRSDLQEEKTLLKKSQKKKNVKKQKEELEKFQKIMLNEKN